MFRSKNIYTQCYGRSDTERPPPSGRCTDPDADSDVLLVSDGELPVPPLDDDLMAALQAMRQDRGLQVGGHGGGRATQ